MLDDLRPADVPGDVPSYTYATGKLAREAGYPPHAQTFADLVKTTGGTRTMAVAYVELGADVAVELYSPADYS